MVAHIVSQIINACDNNQQEFIMNIFKETKKIYWDSYKKEDYIWAKFVSRPPTAFLLASISGVRVTPNQLTFIGLLFGLAGAVCMAFYSGMTGLCISFCLLQLAFMIDCMDGMLARYKNLSSPIGLKLDSLIDTIKVFFLYPAIGYRLYMESENVNFILLVLLGEGIIASDIVMTNFMRSSEYTGKASHSRRSFSKNPIGYVMRLFSFILNYPSWIILPVIFNRMDLFLYISLITYTLYCGYAFLVILFKAGRYSHYAEYR